MKLRNLEDTIKISKPDHHIVESQLLDGERFVLAIDKKALGRLRSLYPSMTIYFLVELKELLKYKNDIEFIKKIHMLKKAFKGWIVPSTIRKG